MPQLPVILTSFANPSDQDHLAHLDQEHNGLQQIFASLHYLRHVPLPSVQTKQLVGFLTRYKNELLIFHFGGHADGSQLQFKDAGARVAGLAENLSLHPQLKLVFLNGCDTQNQAKPYLRAGIPAVIATTRAIADAQAKEFAEVFYTALASKHNLQEAFIRAKGAMKLTDLVPDAKEIVDWRGLQLEEEDLLTELPWCLYVTNNEVLEWRLEELPEITKVDSAHLTIRLGSQEHKILKNLENLQALLEKIDAKSFQSADKIYNIGAISEANFNFTIAQAGYDKNLPNDLKLDLLQNHQTWAQSLRQDLINQGIALGSRSWDTFLHYGWLIEAFLQKMGTPAGQEPSLRRLAFMAEAYQASLRYLCYIQVANVFQHNSKLNNSVISAFLQMQDKDFQHFDYLNLLIVATDLLSQRHIPSFVEEIPGFVQDLSSPQSDLSRTALFLDHHRDQLLHGLIPEDANLPQLLDEYLTALAFWLRKMAFVAKYRLVSIKDINLNYRLGTKKLFAHLYGELHGLYSELTAEEEDYRVYQRENVFTYNQSVLLLKGGNVEIGLGKIKTSDSFLSLSPLVIDQSVFTAKPTQTPEIYYFCGYSSALRHYSFAQYKNELSWGASLEPTSNKYLVVKAQNNQQAPEGP